MDRLTALKVFKTAAQLGSFAEAARRLGLSPAAISKNISELEDHLKTRLFNRTTRRLSLTEAGTAYFDRISPLLDDLEEADEMVSALNTSPTGVLRVTAPQSLTLHCLGRLPARLLQTYPGLSMRLDLDDGKTNIVEAGYDLAIRGGSQLEDSSLMARKLMDLPHVVCAAPAYLDACGAPARPEDLRRHECLTYVLSDHAAEWRFSRTGESIGVAVSGRFFTNSSLAVRDAALEGLGIALLPRLYVDRDLKEDRLRIVLDDWMLPAASVYAIYPSRHHIAPKLRAILDIVAEELAARTEDKTSF